MQIAAIIIDIMRRYLLLTLLFLLVACQSESNNQIRPIRATPTPGTFYFSSTAKPVTFAEIAASPNQFLNQNIRVSGAFSSLPVIKCLPYRGPRIQWALVDSELQMNAVGFDKVVRLLPENYPLTVEGIWRLYRGPLGCGKEPASDAVWYLDVHKIVQPNPISIALQAGLAAADQVEIDAVPPTLPPIAPPEATPTPTPTATPTATPTLLPTDTVTPTIDVTQTVTVTTTPTPGTPTPTFTPSPTPTGTRLATPVGTPDPSATQTLPAPIGTSTPDPNGDNTPQPYPTSSYP